MKKISTILLTLLLVAGCFQAKAQDKFIMVYGSLNYNQSKDEGHEFKANPIGVGYSFTNHVVAGMNFAFDHATNGAGSTTTNKYEVGPFYSYGISIGDHFMLIGQVDAHYQWGQSNLGGKLDQSTDFNGYVLRAYPLASVLLGKGWALKAKFGEISLNGMKGKDPNHTVAQDFIAGFNGDTFGVGVSKNFFIK